jgi:DNA mismatch repair protein MutH
MILKPPPQNEPELMERAFSITGKTLAELAFEHQTALPASMARSKGWVGQLIERSLGAAGDNKPEPDFINLGIELKTLPYNKKGEPQESTYVCTAPMSWSAAKEQWETSRLRKKLNKVLWVPIEADVDIPIAERTIGAPILLTLDPKTEAIIRQDWEELMDILHLGRFSKLSAHYGTYLQIRPKAAHSRILQRADNEDGESQWVGPKGFYLRTLFTRTILKEFYCAL